MFIQKHSLCEENTGQSGSGGDDFKVKFAALEAENERMKAHQQKLLDETKAAKNALKAFEGIDPENIKKMMKTLESSEEAKLLAEGKLDDVVNKRTEKMRLEFDALKEAFTAEITKEKENSKNLLNKYNGERVTLALRQAAEKSGAHAESINDIVNRANGIFSVGVDDKVEARDKDGNLVAIKGKPLDPFIFVEQLKETAPHLWPGSEGHGGLGRRPGNNMKNPFKKGPDYNLTEQAKLANSDPELASQLKAAAG